ncbi:MAG: MiaB/RimO family radical SAM methylthiotransferase [Candidatus Berkelbacteria bacterium]
MNYFILTLGCQMNVADSQRIESKLNSLGYKKTSEKEANLIVVNSCSVRQKGIDRIWGGIKKWRATNKKILISGCVLESDRKKYAARGIDFLHVDDLPKIDKNLKIDHKNQTEHYLEIVPKLSGAIAYIPIMTGCDNFCSYCAVPYTRGREVSRTIDDIVVEAKSALNKGFKEIWLLGQNVNSFGMSKAQKLKGQTNNDNFIKLLNEIDDLDGDFVFNFISSNPQDMGDELIDCFAKLKKWNKELHLAMQSGDNEILRRMNRKETNEEFLALVDKLKSKIENLKLSTDIIVGFPGETEEQFNHTLEACQKIGFEKAYVNQYSPRAGTVSAKMTDDVPREEKMRRWKLLDTLINHKHKL